MSANYILKSFIWNKHIPHEHENNIFWIEYRLISKKGEGTFSEVLKAQSIKTGKYVAIKCMKAHFYNIDQVSLIFINSYR